MNNVRIDDFIEKLRLWSSAQLEIQATAIVGSWARGTARADSDIDVIVVVSEPAKLLDNNGWLKQFGPIDKFVREDWGLVQSLRVYYNNGQEVEFGITTKEWISPEEIDLASGQIMRDGMMIVYDPAHMLGQALLAAQRF